MLLHYTTHFVILLVTAMYGEVKRFKGQENLLGDFFSVWKKKSLTLSQASFGLPEKTQVVLIET